MNNYPKMPFSVVAGVMRKSERRELAKRLKKAVRRGQSLTLVDAWMGTAVEVVPDPMLSK